MFLAVSIVIAALFVAGCKFTEPTRKRQVDEKPTWHTRRPR